MVLVRNKICDPCVVTYTVVSEIEVPQISTLCVSSIFCYHLHYHHYHHHHRDHHHHHYTLPFFFLY